MSENRKEVELSVIESQVMEKIDTAIINLMFNFPFFGEFMAGMHVVLVNNDKWLKTAATDGRRLYFNVSFVLGCDDSELLFLCAHEIFHCVLDHLALRGGRDPDRWNMAVDYQTNYSLKHFHQEQKEVPGIGTMPQGGLYDARLHDDMSCYEIYDWLEQNNVPIEMTLDRHFDFSEDGENIDKVGGEGQVSVNLTGVDEMPKLSKAEAEEIRQEIKNRAIQIASAHGAGSLPKGIQRLINDLIEPKMNWREMLDDTLRSAFTDDYTLERFDDISFWTPFIIPGQDDGERVDACVALDCSGSMSNEMVRDCLSEVAGIMETFRDFRLTVWTFDSQVYESSMKEFRPDNLHEIHTYKYMMKGGGGTTFEANWAFMRKMGIQPHRFIMFTDGLPCSGWGEEDFCPTLFVIHGHPHIEAPFGRTAHYTPN